MSSVNQIGGSTPIQKLAAPPVQKQVAPPAIRSASSADKVELSGAGPLAALKNSDLRADKVASVKAQIQAGTYEDDHKLDVATGRLLDDLMK
jgi:anti-sigma28 factor (negative regulator of flagellin synthesis)